MKNEWIVIGSYLRVSLEDERSGESSSISNQRLIHNTYIQENESLRGCQVLEFIDDGKTGTNFDRHGFQELLRSIRQGIVTCIIVKDFSRLGRNFIETGNLIEQVFPFFGVRFISVNDHFDSQDVENRAGDPTIALKNLVNHLYSLELSEKVSQSKKIRMERGEYISSFAFFGYKKSEEDKRKLVIDEGAASIVRRIYHLYLGGMSVRNIAILFNKEKVPTPMQYKSLTNQRRNGNWEGLKTGLFWASPTVCRTLHDERYTGKYIAGKTDRLMLGSDKRKSVPKKEWIEGAYTHEAIICIEDFEAVQTMMRRTPNQGEAKHDPLARTIKCAECHRTLDRKHNKYACYAPTYTQNEHTPMCKSAFIQAEIMQRIVLDALNTLISTYAKEGQRISDDDQESVENIENRIRGKEVVLQKLKTRGMVLYEKYRLGTLPKETYLTDKQKLTQQIEDESAAIADLNQRISNLQNAESEMKFVPEKAGQYKGYQELTRELVKALIDKIIVQDQEHVELRWNFKKPDIERT